MKSRGYYLGQIPQFLAQLLGFVLLALPCITRAWGFHGQKSNKVWTGANAYLNGRDVDSWNWEWLNNWYGNPEDGVSGNTALVWTEQGKLVQYNPMLSRWKAYAWSAWRNSSDALKYKFPQE
jgi:hypothetical protein